MTGEKRFVDAPRMQIVLIPEGDAINSPSTLFDIWLVLHMPDGKAPTTVRVDGGPYNREGALGKLADMWGAIGKQYAEPTAI